MNEDNRNSIVSLIEHKNIKKENIRKVLEEVGITPSSHDWFKFIEQLLLWFGALALAFAMMFFIAYNWSEFGQYGKFALVEGAMALSVGAYLYLDETKLSSKVMLFVSSILLGVLLALFGQTYQTGADTWQLFFYWAVLILPWVLVGRLPALWIFWIFLINLSIVLYIATFGRLFGFYFYEQSSLLWLFFGFNTFAFVLWEFLANKFEWLNSSWAIRLLALISGTAITWLVVSLVWEEHQSVLCLGAWIVWLGGIYHVYRVRQIDLFILSLAAFSFSMVLVNVLIKGLFSLDFNLIHILFIGMVIIGLGAGFASWLKALHKELNNESQNI